MRWNSLQKMRHEKAIFGSWWFAWHPVMIDGVGVWLEKVWRWKDWDCDGIYSCWSYSLTEVQPPSAKKYRLMNLRSRPARSSD